MKGHGFYDANSTPQRAAMDAFLPSLLEAVPTIPVPHSNPLNILDVGSSEGANAIHAVTKTLNAFRAVSPGPVRVLFDDLPTNDFNQLFTNLFPDGSSVFKDDQVFTAAVAGSAFTPLVPPRNLHIATTFNAIGFLETKPDSPLPHFILPEPPGPHAPRDGVGVTPKELAPFRRESEANLRAFYAARAEELVPGGRLLVQCFGKNDEFSTSHGIYDVLSDAILDEVEAGALPRGVYERLVFPIVFRTSDDLVAPISMDADLSSRFRVDRADSVEVVVPFNRLQEEGRIEDWAAAYTRFFRAFTEAILSVGLPGSGDKTALVESIYQRAERRLIAEPSRYPFRYLSIGALLTRL